jgi:DmsE family decaheme c-type cytochrome
MGRQLRKMGQKTWMAFAFLVWLIALVGLHAGTPPAPGAADKSPTKQDSSQAATPAVPADAKYVGDDSCLGCHEEQRAGYERSPHHWASDPRTPAAEQGCETCHGPGSKHADDPDHVNIINDFTVMKPDAINAVCTTCHNRGDHALWDGSQHERRGVTCTNCHSLHSPKSDTGFLKAKTEPEVCAACHRDKAAKVERAVHMPLGEGKMACSSCHDPHGSTNVKLLRKGDSISELCTSCHADKRGPFLYEHAPARDGCVTCHDPHGSANDSMLVVKTPMLCQRCHVGTRHPSTIYDSTNITSTLRVYSRACVMCHADIHGSNHPAGRFFIR